MFPRLRVPRLGVGVSPSWETRLGVGEGREVGRGGRPSKIIPARGRVPLRDGERVPEAQGMGQPQQPGDTSEPRESLGRGLFCSSFGI